jgi:hypothetical protein
MFLVANLPTVNCYIRREYLYDFTKGHGEYEPCYWVSVKSIQGQALRIEAYLPNYGALYDKFPISAFVSRNTDLKPDEFLPLDHLQIWDCMAYDITVIKKSFLQNLGCKFLAKNKQWYSGQYLFTIDHANADSNITPTGFAEEPMDHKSFNVIQLDNGQYAAQPNNRTIFLDPSSNPKELAFPDFKVYTKKHGVEKDAKWAVGDSDKVMYD